MKKSYFTLFYILLLYACLILHVNVSIAQSINDPHVAAAWDFEGNDPAKDLSGSGRDLKLRGEDSHFIKEGYSGGALMIEEKIAPGDTRQGAQVRNSKPLNPRGAFSIEMQISPGEQLAKKSIAYLIDKKYFHYKSEKDKSKAGYLLLLRQAKDQQFYIEGQLGFGDATETARSEPQSFEVGKRYLITFAYDGAGKVTFYVNKNRAGETRFKGRNAIAPSAYDIIIGDRIFGTGQRFLGKIDSVSIFDKKIHYASGKILLDSSDARTAFYRMEKDASLRLNLLNDTGTVLEGAFAQISLGGIQSKYRISELKVNESSLTELPVNTQLRPDTYKATITVESPQGKIVSDPIEVPVHIVARPLPGRMPIIMWGVANRAYNTKSYDELSSLGYTGQLMYGAVDNQHVWENRDMHAASDTTRKNIRRRLDAMLLSGVNAHLSVGPGRWAYKAIPEFNRSDRLGKRIDNDINGLHPEIQQLAKNTGKALAHSYGDMPAWAGALIHTEVRDHTAPSFNEIDKKAFRDFSGYDIPPQIKSARGTSYQSLPTFPANRIIKDDHPILKYYKWFWKTGDGWPKLNSLVNDGLKNSLSAAKQSERMTWFDPSVRAPSIYGSGGDVDYLNQWTYTYPDPLKVGLATDEQFAMAEGQPGQEVMNMIQIIWYREQTTKKPQKGKEVEWEKTTPNAKFISIAPDHLSEGTWLELARPIQGIANHGWASMGKELGYTENTYTTTNLETRKRVTYLNNHVVKPLGPTLRQVPDYQTDVAFLESFSSQMFAGRGTYGWGRGWGADSYIVVRHAGLQPKILYEEIIEKEGLDKYKVLFMTDCDVIPEKVAEQIYKFQQRGGIVVGDENLAPGILPDIVIKSIIRKEPHVTKAELLKAAEQLRNELSEFYQAPAHSDNPEVITRLRQSGSSQYLFTVNDHRTYGDYVGQHKMVMEKGLPSSAEITLKRLNGYIYDLMQKKQISIKRSSDSISFPVELGGGEGNVFLITEKPIGKPKINSASSVKQGNRISIKVLLPDSNGDKIDAVIPLDINIQDAEGRVAEMSGYYGAKNGELDINLDIAPNDVTGMWKVTVTEGATAQTVTQQFEVK